MNHADLVPVQYFDSSALDRFCYQLDGKKERSSLVWTTIGTRKKTRGNQPLVHQRAIIPAECRNLKDALADHHCSKKRLDRTGLQLPQLCLKADVVHPSSLA
jgi:hypothetical protein